MTAPSLRKLDGSPNPPALGDIARVQAQLRPDAIAISFEGALVTYGELYRRAVRVANGLTAEGAGPGSRVAYLGKNHAAFFEIFIGAAIAGAVLVPFNWRLTPTEVAYLIDDSGALIIFAGLEHKPLAEAAAEQAAGSPAIIAIEGDYEAWRDSAAAADPHIHVDPHATAMQLYTSGTTGAPKGAELSHHALNSVRVSQPRENQWSRWTDRDVCLVSMPLFHVGGVGTALNGLYHGARLVVARDFKPDAVFDYLDHEHITKFFIVPTAIRGLLDHPRSKSTNYSRVTNIYYGSSSISPDLLNEVFAIFKCGLTQFYGMTETSGAIVVLPPEDHSIGGPKMRSAGKPMVGVDIRILGPTGDILPAGDVGEIAVRSAANMTGYWNLPEATKACFAADGYLRSGDVGYLDRDGYLFVCDRLKDMIISGGENVYSAEVEGVLCEHPDIAEIAVIGTPHPKWGEAVVGVAVPTAGALPDSEALRGWARERLAGYKVPRTLVFVDALPKNGTGKVLRRELRERYAQFNGRLPEAIGRSGTDPR